MHRALCLFVGFLAFVGSGDLNPATAASDCAGKSVGDPCDDDIFCNGADFCGPKTIDGRPVLGCFLHNLDPCPGGSVCADACNEAERNCFDAAETPCTDDNNVCTDDVCDGAGNCDHRPNTAPCDDDVFCNGADTCENGECSMHAGDPCVGGPECANTCNEDVANCLVPQFTPCTDDGNACTDDVCDIGVCAHVPNNRPCDDGLFCNGEDSCGNGSCSFHSGDPCAGGPECARACDETSNACAIPMGTLCSDDGNPCTEDLCMNGGCVHAAIPGCELCEVDTDCDDANPCTDDVCGLGGCENTRIPDCLACTVDSDCNDDDACTIDRCGPTNRCTYSDPACFAAVSCGFVGRLEVDACVQERVPRVITRLFDRAGCRVQRAQARASNGRNGIEKHLKSAERRLERAIRKVTKSSGRRISAPCAQGLLQSLDGQLAEIIALMDTADGGSRLATCAALAAGGTAPDDGLPSLCK
jgi:hypothetical protein